LKPDGYNQTTEVAGVAASAALERLRRTNIVRNDSDRDLLRSHDWHVQPDCQRSTPETA